jgi:signal transduction histidine kinase
MLGLVSDILDFERIENNRLDLESIPFSILYESDKAITILSVAAKRKGITVEKVLHTLSRARARTVGLPLLLVEHNAGLSCGASYARG